MQNDIQNSQKPEITNQKQIDKKLIVEVNVPPDHEMELVCHHLDQEGNPRYTEILKTYSGKDNKKVVNPSVKKWKRASSVGFSARVAGVHAGTPDWVAGVPDLLLQ